jgi:hypothetical protein
MPFSRMFEGCASLRALSSSTACALPFASALPLVSLVVSSFGVMPSSILGCVLTSQQLVTVEIEVVHSNLSARLALIVLICLYFVESVCLLLCLPVFLVAISAILFGLGSLVWNESKQSIKRALYSINPPAPPLASSCSIFSSTLSSIFSSTSSFAIAAFTSSRLASSGMTSSRVFCCFFLLLVGEASSALRLVPLVVVAAGGLELVCAALRADWRVPAIVVDWCCVDIEMLLWRIGFKAGGLISNESGTMDDM